MDYSFARYLLSKQSVDDRALNKDVFHAMKASLPEAPIRIIEVGAGIGTMVRRLVRWDVLHKADYVLVDKLAENIEYASAWIPQWAEAAGLSVERSGQNQFRVFDAVRDVHIQLEQADVFEFIQYNKKPADLLIAHALLDLLPMPESLSKMLALTNSSAWLTLNFDGVTTLEPLLDEKMDALIEVRYHSTMDTRPTGGSSRRGRSMFSHLEQMGVEIVAAGSSDWVVHPRNGGYPQDEAYFLLFILHFIEQSVWTGAELTEDKFQAWLQSRRQQIAQGGLTYIAHQLDFLVKK